MASSMGMDDDETGMVLDHSIEENVKSKNYDEEEEDEFSDNNKTVMTKKIEETSTH